MLPRGHSSWILPCCQRSRTGAAVSSPIEPTFSAAPGSPRLSVVLGLGRPQERRLLAACREHTGVRIVARCSSAQEAIGWMRRRAADVALLDEDLHMLGDDALAELDAGRFATVVLTRDPDSERWRGLRLFPLSTEAEPITALLALGEAFRGESPIRVNAEPAVRAAAVDPRLTRLTDPRLQVFAFWGGAGSPGRTTVAINWCALLGSVAPTILVDLDLTGAAVAAQLDGGGRNDAGQVRLVPNLVQLASAGPDSPEGWTRELARLVQPLGQFSPHAEILAGVPRPRLRAALSAAFVERLIGELRARYAYIVLDLGDEPLCDVSQGRRPVEEGVAVAALRAADQTMVVCPPDGPGLHQAYTALAEAGQLLNRERAALIVNRYDQRHHQAELSRVEDGLELPLVAVLPLDYRSVQRALAEGRPAVCDARSKLRRPLQELAERVHGGQLRMRISAPPRSAAPWARLRGVLAGVALNTTAGKLP